MSESIPRRGHAIWLALAALALLMSACASYGSRLQPGVSTINEVLADMGQPAMRWQDPDGRVQLAYPKAPMGTQTLMVFLAPDGRLERVEKVLDMKHFARIVPGVSDTESVLRLLGPPWPEGTIYFETRNELAWEWPFCDDWGKRALFNVLFDGTTGVVRTSFQFPDLRGFDGIAPGCGH